MPDEAVAVTWEQQLLALWDDLELQAEGLALRQRDAEVAERARSEYAEVDLAGRLAASVGRPVELEVVGAGRLRGRLAGAGSGWVLLVEEPYAVRRAAATAPLPRVEWVVRLAAVAAARGLSDAARPAAVRPLTARLGVGSVLRRLAEQRAEVVCVDPAGGRRSGLLGRVGADFVELRSEDRIEVLPFGGLAALRSR